MATTLSFPETENRNRAIIGIVVAVLASLLLHAVLYYWFHILRLDFGAPTVDPIEPVRFHVDRTSIDPKHLEQEPALPPISGNNPQNSRQPMEVEPGKIAAFDGPLQAPSIPVPRLTEMPTASLSADAAPAPVEAFSALPLDADGKYAQAAQAMANEAGTAALAEAGQALKPSNLAGGGDGAVSAKGAPGFSEISNLANLRAPTALGRPAFQPILIRLSSDVLFAFDSAQLKPEAEASLGLVATALAKATRAKITVEGHSDTIGEEAYDQKLSEQRAEAVAKWLMARTGFGPDHIQFHGYGKTRPIVNPLGSIEEQARNRRVEIRVEGER